LKESSLVGTDRELDFDNVQNPAFEISPTADEAWDFANVIASTSEVLNVWITINYDGITEFTAALPALSGGAVHKESGTGAIITEIVFPSGKADGYITEAFGYRKSDGGWNWSFGEAEGGSGGATNLSATPSSANVVIASDTGTDATISAADGTNAGLLLPAEKTKLAGIATGATANDTDANLKNRANHTGTQIASTISDFAAAVGIAIAATYEAVSIANGVVALDFGTARKVKAITISEAKVFTSITNPVLDESRTFIFDGTFAVSFSGLNAIIAGSYKAGESNKVVIYSEYVDSVTPANNKYIITFINSNDPYLDQSGSKVSATASGTNTYTATIAPAITAYSTYQNFKIKFPTAPTAASTLNLNGIGAKKLFKTPTSQVGSGDFPANSILSVVYDSSLDSTAGGWLIVGGIASSGGMSDGDKGDITVGGGGTTLSIDANAVTVSKIEQIAQYEFLGRATSGTGNVEKVVGVTEWTTVPATLSSTGAQGQKAVSEGVLYFCVSTNTWVKVNRLKSVDISSTTTLLTSDPRNIRGSGTITINLFAASADTLDDEIYIKNVGSGTITIDANGSQTIDGALTYSLSTQYSYVCLKSTSSGWDIKFKGS
jgi:hypothetical protein